MEALNGLTAMSPGVPSAPLYDEINFSGSLSGDSRQLSSPEHSGESSLQKGKVSKSPDRYGPFKAVLHPHETVLMAFLRIMLKLESARASRV